MLGSLTEPCPFILWGGGGDGPIQAYLWHIWSARWLLCIFPRASAISIQETGFVRDWKHSNNSIKHLWIPLPDPWDYWMWANSLVGTPRKTPRSYYLDSLSNSCTNWSMVGILAISYLSNSVPDTWRVWLIIIVPQSTKEYIREYRTKEYIREYRTSV